MSPKRTIRCAIYTRKSSEEGLDQDFNSLDAQYEACSAFIASQASEGWKLMPHRYDDGGRSGGTLERPALERLMEDIRAGGIDMIVVYKVDRLTRSLADFARLIDELDRHDCSFVAVTQAFNTSTSMGRLTLNVLLSFAQFEREVTAERIRDKIAASKKKGMWMGGNVPLGYRVLDRKLIIEPQEAKLVRHIHDLYQNERCLNAVEATLEREGVCTPVRTTKAGRKMGGAAFSRGQIYRLLASPLYAGWVSHKGERHEGLHEAIISREEWAATQARLTKAANARQRRKPGQAAKRSPKAISPLAGKLFNESGERFSPSHTKTPTGRKRYYVSLHKMIRKGDASPKSKGWRLPAEPLESSVREAIGDHLKAPDRLYRLTETDVEAMTAKPKWGTHPPCEEWASADNSSWANIVERITVAPGNLSFALNADALATLLAVHVEQLRKDALQFAVPFQIRRRGIEMKLITGKGQTHLDPVLIRGIAQGKVWLDRMMAGESIADMAREMGWTEPPIRQRIKLAFLSPAIVRTILAGQQPVDLTLDRLLRREIPIDWQAQAETFGFETA